MKLRIVFALAVAALACVALGGSAVAGRGHGHGHGNGRLYVFSGTLLAAPGPNATSLSVQVETGNRPALRALIGSSQNQVFAIGADTRVLVWSNGIPHVGGTGDLKEGDYLTLRIHAPFGATLQQIVSTPSASVADHAAPHGGAPLWLFVGTVAGPQSGGQIALHVASGNWKALQAMLGQPLDQTFTYDDGTIFLLWQSGVPTVIEPSQLKAGDRITVRIRAPRDASLVAVEAKPAAHVGDHEPAPAPED